MIISVVDARGIMTQLKKRPIVRQSSDDDINYNNPTTIKDYFGLLNIFLNGINIQVFFPNALSCSTTT